MPNEVASFPEAVDDPPLPAAPPITTPASKTAATGKPNRRRPGRRVPRTAPVVGRPGSFSLGAWRPAPQLPAALQEPAFRRWWLAQLVALFGVWTQNTAVQLVVLSITSSAFMIGAINIVSGVPLLLLSLIGGVVADKSDRRRILLFTQTTVSMLSVGWAVLIFTDSIQYWHILVLAALGGTVASFDLPAGQAFLSQIVRREHMPEAIALGSISVNGTRSIGPAFAGVLIGLFGTGVAFLTHSMTVLIFVGAIFSLAALVPRHRPSAGGERGLTALRKGLAHIRKSDDLLGLVGTTAIFSFLAVPGLLVLMPLFVTKTLGGGDGWVPAMTSVFGMGSLTAALVMFRGSKHESAAGRRLRTVSITLGLGLLWLALSPNPWVAIPGVYLAGCSFEMGLVQIQTRIQQLAPDDMRGRVLSVNGLAFNGVMPASTLSLSSAASVFGLPVVLGFCAVGTVTLTTLLWRKFTWKAFVPAPA